MLEAGADRTVVTVKLTDDQERVILARDADGEGWETLWRLMPAVFESLDHLGYLTMHRLTVGGSIPDSLTPAGFAEARRIKAERAKRS